jgi:hypothetical protein
MKTFILSLLLFSTVAHASPPRLESWEKILQSKFDYDDRSLILKLATFIPTLFGVHFVCQFTSADKAQKPIPIIPGEWIPSPVGGALHCPDNFDITLEKDAKIRIRQTMSGVPMFFLESGEAHFRFGQESFFLETPTSTMAAAGETKGQLLNIQVSPQKETVDCALGAVSMSYEGKEGATSSRKLVSHLCRIEVTVPPNPDSHYLLDTDDVAVENLSLSRNYWPKTAATTPVPGAPQSPGGVAGMRLIYGDGKLNLLYVNMLSDPECTLFGQKSEASPIKEISKFKAKTNTEIPFDHAFVPGVLSLLCNTEKGTIASNAAVATQ